VGFYKDCLMKKNRNATRNLPVSRLWLRFQVLLSCFFVFPKSLKLMPIITCHFRHWHSFLSRAVCLCGCTGHSIFTYVLQSRRTGERGLVWRVLLQTNSRVHCKRVHCNAQIGMCDLAVQRLPVFKVCDLLLNWYWCFKLNSNLSCSVVCVLCCHCRTSFVCMMASHLLKPLAFVVFGGFSLIQGADQACLGNKFGSS
jgi:hypothetical protein